MINKVFISIMLK